MFENESSKKCAYTKLLPLYIITCKTHLKHYDIDLNEIPYLQYVVHPKENDRMQRIIDGTHDPIYDLVHELRYNPTIGIEVRQAKKRFEKYSSANNAQNGAPNEHNSVSGNN